MQVIEVKFIGGYLSGATALMEENEFAEGDILDFAGSKYLMHGQRAYRIQLPDSNN